MKTILRMLVIMLTFVFTTECSAQEPISKNASPSTDSLMKFSKSGSIISNQVNTMLVSNITELLEDTISFKPEELESVIRTQSEWKWVDLYAIDSFSNSHWDINQKRIRCFSEKKDFHGMALVFKIGTYQTVLLKAECWNPIYERRYDGVHVKPEPIIAEIPKKDSVIVNPTTTTKPPTAKEAEKIDNRGNDYYVPMQIGGGDDYYKFCNGVWVLVKKQGY